jgi:hypothetical protein
MHHFNWVDSILRNGKTLTRYNKSDAVISLRTRTRRSSQVTSHVIFSRENVRDAYASRTARLDMRVALHFLLSNFLNKEQYPTYLSWSESFSTIHVRLI